MWGRYQGAYHGPGGLGKLLLMVSICGLRTYSLSKMEVK